MLDIKFIRENKEAVQVNAQNRKATVSIDEIIELDDRRKELQFEIDGLRQEINTAAKHKPTDEEREKLRKIGDAIAKLETEIKTIEKELREKLSWVPNMSAPDMPVGKGEDANQELKVWIPGEGYLDERKLGTGNNAAKYMPTFKDGVHHLALGEKLDIIDTKQSALTSGSRFAYLKNEAVLLQYGLFELLKNKLLSLGFTPMIPPVMVKEQILFGTSHFPEGRDQVYKIENQNTEDNVELFLVGSSEPSLFGYHMNKVTPEKALPAKMFALTTCFRSEVGSWGKDVRGIKRVHQFDKLEMDVVATEEQAESIMEELLSVNEWLLQSLKIPYRVLNKCTGDCGYLATYKQYDVEVWLPGQKEFMETMTDTNATDYQARRLHIKYLTKDNQKKFAYTINDTGCAMGRMIIAILDNYQQADGTVQIPEVLQQYVGKDVITPKKM